MIAKKILVLSLVFMTRRIPLLRETIFLAGIDLKLLSDSKVQRREYIYNKTKHIESQCVEQVQHCSNLASIKREQLPEF